MKFTLFHFSCIAVAPFGYLLFFSWESVSVLFVQNVLLRGAGWGRKRSYRTAASSKKIDYTIISMKLMYTSLRV